ncbi:MAG: hypothetical protein RMH77_06005 [Sulfolobales archaeon]|nr:hypothetical protein [Sulfolobales archaeon]MDW7969937.1 hypothetical protein [Sulfolobales archaeon]
MTHTHHRVGPIESLKKDYVVLVMASRLVKYENEREKFKRIMEILARHNPVNLGNMVAGNKYWRDEEEVVSKFKEYGNIVHGVYTSGEQVKNVLKDLKEAELGLSVVVTGVYAEVFNILKEVGLKPHTVNLSLGIWGRTEKLPQKEILEITTMCGHCMVSPSLVLKMVAEIKKGHLSPASAAVELSKACVCGVFNVKRAEEVLRRLVKGRT